MYEMKIKRVAPGRIVNRRQYIRKQRIKVINENTIIVIMCITFTVIGMLLLRNEINEDDWYIEATADGLFGVNNRSLLTLCTNYIITGIIYLLSLTGIRLFWLHWIFVVMQFISSLLVCKLIMLKANSDIGYILCFTFLALITPLIYFYMQFTLTAAYVIATGCLWLFYSLEYRKSKVHYIFSAVWIILGASIRIDCFAYAIVFMGILWIFKIAKYMDDHRTELVKRFIRKTIFRYLTPFLSTLFVLAIIQCSQEILMEHSNPGFSDWNTLRSQVDDYNIPDYKDYIEDYQELGMSYNDYLLLRSWNNQDPDFFTEDLYEKILDIKSIYQNEGTVESGVIKDIISSIKIMSGYIIFWVGVVLTLYAYCCMGLWYGMACTAVILCEMGLTAYFIYIGRLEWRVDWPIWMFVLISMISVFLTPSTKHLTKEPLKCSFPKKLIVLMVCMSVLFVRPRKITLNSTWSTNVWNPYYGTSVFENYMERYASPTSYGYYLYAKMSNNVLPYSETEDTVFTSYIVDNKDKLFFVLFDDVWKHQFPLTDKDFWRTGAIGDGENWYFLGQYESYLSPMQKRLIQQKIDNPFKALVNENVRIAVKELLFQLYPRTVELNRYLKEHYYDDVNFSVEAIVNHTIVGRYMRNFDIDGMVKNDGKLELEYGYSSQFEGMSQIWLSGFQISNFTVFHDPAYLEITNSDGETFTCTTMDSGDGRLIAMFYNDIIQENKNYTIRFIYKHYGVYFYIDAGTLQRKIEKGGI